MWHFAAVSVDQGNVYTLDEVLVVRQGQGPSEFEFLVHIPLMVCCRSELSKLTTKGIIRSNWSKEFNLTYSARNFCAFACCLAGPSAKENRQYF